MSKSRTKDGAGNKGGKTQWQKQIDRLKEVAKPGEQIRLETAMSEPVLYNWLNESLDVALKAAGLDPDEGYRNFAKLICTRLFSYPRESYFSDIPFQRKLTRDILELTENKFNDDIFIKALSCFDLLRNLKAPKNPELFKFTDEQVKDYFLPEC